MTENGPVLIVGGAGYLGSVLVEELLARGYSVRVFDRLFFGEVGLRNVIDRVSLISGDMRCMDPSVLKDVQTVINLGGLSNDPTAEYNPDANFQMNTSANESLARMAKENGVQRFVFASTCSIYDFGVIDQERDVLLTEESPVGPRAAYARSKLEGEAAMLRLADDDFCPVILRMATLFGFSPRMRYDLVVNTFVKDSLSRGYMTLHYGGQIWRPLLEVRDAARAYITAIEADRALVDSEVFNVVEGNYRISELALRVRDALKETGVQTELRTDFEYSGVRNYRVSGKKISNVLNYKPVVSVEESVKRIVDQIGPCGCNDFENDRYYNIRWMKLLDEVHEIIKITGTVFDMPSSSRAKSVAAEAGRAPA